MTGEEKQKVGKKEVKEETKIRGRGAERQKREDDSREAKW